MSVSIYFPFILLVFSSQAEYIHCARLHSIAYAQKYTSSWHTTSSFAKAHLCVCLHDALSSFEQSTVHFRIFTYNIAFKVPSTPHSRVYSFCNGNLPLYNEEGSQTKIDCSVANTSCFISYSTPALRQREKNSKHIASETHKSSVNAACLLPQ